MHPLRWHIKVFLSEHWYFDVWEVSVFRNDILLNYCNFVPESDVLLLFSYSFLFVSFRFCLFLGLFLFLCIFLCLFQSQLLLLNSHQIRMSLVLPLFSSSNLFIFLNLYEFNLPALVIIINSLDFINLKL